MAVILGADSGASQINEVVLLNSIANTVTLGDGRVYQKAGVVETTTSNYPNATVGILYTGDNFSTSGTQTTLYGLTWDGSHLWVTGGSGDTNTKWSTAGVYQSVSFTHGSQDGLSFGIGWDGTNFWVSGYTTNKIYKYNSSGVYQSSYIDVSSEFTSPFANVWVSGYMWVVDGTGTIYKYNSSGTYQNVSFSTSDQEPYPRGIAWDGSDFWVVGNNSIAYKYNSSGVYQSEFFDLRGQIPTGQCYAITHDGTNFWALDINTDKIYKYISGVGINELSATAQAYGAQLMGNVYTRVA